MKYLLYLKYLIRHKYFVGRECFKLGLYWQGIIHDWHKFLPSEFFPYCEFFYGKFKFEPSWLGYSYNQQEQDYQETTKKKFDIAWLLHQHRAKHHFQHWILRLDSGETKALEMPEKYIKEMYCDWKGPGIASSDFRFI